MVIEQDIARVCAEGDPPGRLAGIEMLEPLPARATTGPIHGCSALALVCEADVLVLWSPSRLGSQGRVLGTSPARLVCTRLDHSSWPERRMQWQALLAPLGARRCLSDHALEAAPQWRHWLGRPLQFPKPLRQGLAWRLQSMDGQLHRDFAAGEQGAVCWTPAARLEGRPASRATEEETADDWLMPGTPMPVQLGIETFRSACFEGWPLSWRRRFALQAGLAAGAPVNTRQCLPAAVRDGAEMSEWTCRALQLRFAAWPQLRRRLALMAPPSRLPGIRAGDIERWWPRWKSSGLATGERLFDHDWSLA